MIVATYFRYYNSSSQFYLDEVIICNDELIQSLKIPKKGITCNNIYMFVHANHPDNFALDFLCECICVEYSCLLFYQSPEFIKLKHKAIVYIPIC